MADLYVNVDGQMVPLTECHWVLDNDCGHPRGILLAAIPGLHGRAYADEEQAWREFYPRARERDAARRRGVTVRLVRRSALDDAFWDALKVDCGCRQRNGGAP